MARPQIGPTELAPPTEGVPPPPEPPSSGLRIAWVRRRRAMGRVVRVYRRSKMGMAGLLILAFFVAVAVLAPLIANREALNPTCPYTGPPLQAPSVEFPFGTDDLG